MIRVSLIVAAAENDVIGAAGGLPWHIPSDLRRFRALTMGLPVIMGGATFASLPRALEGRRMMVVSRTPAAAPAETYSSLEAALAAAQNPPAAEIAIIGGARLFAAALPYATHIHFTRVHAAPCGDTHFAVPPGFIEIDRGRPRRGERDEFSVTDTTFHRVAAPRPLPPATSSAI